LLSIDVQGGLGNIEVASDCDVDVFVPQSLPLVTCHRRHSFTQSSQSLQHDATKQNFIHPRLRERSLSIRCHPRAVFRRRNHSTRTTAFARLTLGRSERSASAQRSALSLGARMVPDWWLGHRWSPILVIFLEWNLWKWRRRAPGSSSLHSICSPGLLLSLPWYVSHRFSGNARTPF